MPALEGGQDELPRPPCVHETVQAHERRTGPAAVKRCEVQPSSVLRATVARATSGSLSTASDTTRLPPEETAPSLAAELTDEPK